jgi:DNA-binding winged helix-turn-helix (wHTH) protein
MRLRFGTFTLDLGSRQLFRADTDVHLSPKAFELLKVLVERRPQALAKADLQNHLWPDTFVSEANLPLLVGEIRRALGDSARRPRYVRTLLRFGYAFCGQATAIAPETSASQPHGGACWLVWKGQRLDLRQGENVIGREADASVQLHAPSVSRRHACITLAETGAVLEDLASKNGTYVRGERITAPSRLQDGDQVRFGSAVATFRISSPDAPTETTRPQ